MVINCSVYNCKSRFDKSSLTSFHRFPLNDEILCKKWATATKCLQITPSKHSRICSKHFKLEDFECQENGKRVLKKNIVPSIFDFHESLNKNNKRNQLYNDDTSHIKKTICSISNKEVTELEITNTIKEKILKQSSPKKLLLRKKIKILKQKLKRKDKKIASLSKVIQNLEKKKIISIDVAELLENNFSGLTKELLKSELKNRGKKKKVIDTLKKLKNLL